jgi:hypothetical protein
MLLSVSALVVVAPNASAAITTSPGQSTYLPRDPVRVLDSRGALGGHPGTFGAGEFFDLAVPGAPTGATAVVLNVTAVDATAATNIRVYPTPTDGSVPTVSNLNVDPRVTVADLVTVQLGTGGQVRLRNDAGSVNLLADLAGWYVAGSTSDTETGSGLHPVAPLRLVDTRSTQSPLAPGESRKVEVRLTADGQDSGVASNATAVVLNVTAVQPSAGTYLTVYPGPDPATKPVVSNLNPRRGDTVAGLVIAKVDDATDSVEIYNNAGSTNVVVDLAGWYETGGGDVFHPVAPYRALDTRSSSAVAAGAPRLQTVAGARTVPFLATAVAMTVTAVRPTSPTNVVVYPYVPGGPRPTASNVNLTRGQIVPNAAIVQVGASGQVAVDNAVGSVNAIVDVSGWFGPAAEGYDISWPQCTPTRTDTTSKHPATGGFAVIGLTNGKPYTTNACLADAFAWAESLGGGGAGYIILNAPGQGDANWGAHASPQSCDGTTSVGCGYDYGWWAADYAITSNRLPRDAQGGLPQVWLDVEGPYTSGPVWQDITTTSGQAVNAAVVRGARDRLTAAGLRSGIYSRRLTTNTAGTRTDDWYKLTGNLALTNTQQWVFPRSTDPDEANNPPSDARMAELASQNCTPAKAFTGGDVVLSQYQTQVDATTFDTNHAC